MGYVDSLLGKGERILVIARKHWTTLLMSGLVSLFIVAILLVLYALSGDASPLKFLSGVRAVFLFALVLPLGKFGWDFIQWEAEQYLVSNYRVIQTEGIVNKRTSDSSLEKVNDVVLTQSVLGRVLGYGDLAIITGSDVGTNLLKRLSEPVRFKTAMLDAKMNLGGHDEDRHRPVAQPVPVAGAILGSKPAAQADDDDPLQQIARLDDLRKSGAINDADYQAAKAKLLSKL